jgi:hypothetical protein
LKDAKEEIETADTQIFKWEQYRQFDVIVAGIGSSAFASDAILDADIERNFVNDGADSESLLPLEGPELETDIAKRKGHSPFVVCRGLFFLQKSQETRQRHCQGTVAPCSSVKGTGSKTKCPRKADHLILNLEAPFGSSTFSGIPLSSYVLSACHILIAHSVIFDGQGVR